MLNLFPTQDVVNNALVLWNSSIFRSTSESYRLAVRGFVSLEGRRISRLQCVTGSAWVSYDGHDRVIQRGEQVCVETQDRVAVQSLGVSSIELVVN